MQSLKPPSTIKGESLKEWQRVCAELEALGRLTAVDRAILTLHCQTWAINREAYQTVQSEGQIITFSNGTVGQSPQYKNWKETTTTLRGTLSDLGLTPESRNYVTDKPKEDEAPADLEL